MTRGYMPSAITVEWETPQWLFDELHREFGFTLDPCATHETAKCDKYFTKEEDGLKQSWDNEIVFMNPPYGRGLEKWVKKAYDSKALVVGLLPVRSDTRWFHDHIYNDPNVEIRFLKGRVKFLNGQRPQPAPFPSMVVIWR